MNEKYGISAEKLEEIQSLLSHNGGEKFTNRLTIMCECFPDVPKATMKAILMARIRTEKKMHGEPELTDFEKVDAKVDAEREAAKAQAPAKEEEPTAADLIIEQMNQAAGGLSAALDFLKVAEEAYPKELQNMASAVGMIKSMQAEVSTFRAGVEWAIKEANR